MQLRGQEELIDISSIALMMSSVVTLKCSRGKEMFGFEKLEKGSKLLFGVLKRD